MLKTGSAGAGYDRLVITNLTRTFLVDDVSIAWDRWGAAAGTPLFLCHGFSGSSHDFAMHIESFAKSRSVVSVDHRGHGRSQKLGLTAGYTIDRLADDLIALLDATVCQPVDLLGHSMGGAIALRVVLARPDLVHSLILMDTSAWSFVPTDDGIAAMMKAFMDSYDPAHGLPDMTAWSGPEDSMIEATMPDGWQSIKAEMSASFDPFALKALGSELFSPATSSTRDRLKEITCPVTVIVGENDHPFVEQAPALQAELPNGKLTVIAGAYHSPQLTHVTEWAAAVEAHLAG